MIEDKNIEAIYRLYEKEAIQSWLDRTAENSESSTERTDDFVESL